MTIGAQFHCWAELVHRHGLAQCQQCTASRTNHSADKLLIVGPRQPTVDVPGRDLIDCRHVLALTGTCSCWRTLASVEPMCDGSAIVCIHSICCLHWWSSLFLHQAIVPKLASHCKDRGGGQRSVHIAATISIEQTNSNEWHDGMAVPTKRTENWIIFLYCTQLMDSHFWIFNFVYLLVWMVETFPKMMKSKAGAAFLFWIK